MIELTDEQRAFAQHPREAFVQACPGSGKTRAVVGRLAELARAMPSRRGIGVLSFTNSAVDEFSRRCAEAGLGSLLHHPGFIGTFDAFVRHFILLPSGIPASQVRPIIVDSWESMDIQIRLRGDAAFAGEGVSLDLFDSATNAIDPIRISHVAQQDHVRRHQARYEGAARMRREALWRTGYLSAADARVIALGRVRDPHVGSQLGRALAARFVEIIVDEAQDCDPGDLEIIRWLRTSGIRASVVCDPDQAIYGFRQGVPANLRTFAQSYAADDRLGFSGNFRSAPPICTLAATLRGNAEADRAIGVLAQTTHPIVVLPYGARVDAEIGRAFAAHLDRLGIARQDGMVLAHRRRNAQTATGDPAQLGEGGESKIAMLAQAAGAYWAASASGQSRSNALLTVEKLILDFMGLLQAGDHVSRAITRHRLNPRTLRRQAVGFVAAVPRTCADTDEARTQWIQSAREAAASLSLPLPAGKTIKGYFRTPPQGTWSRYLNLPTSVDVSCGTIHEAKGRQYQAVCVVFPPDRAPNRYTSALFDAWEQRIDDEAKRVAYVGVTRAMKFAMLAIPTAAFDRCHAILQAGDVPFERADIVRPG